MSWIYTGIMAAGVAMKIGSMFTKKQGTKQGLDLGGSALMMGGSFGAGGGFGGGASTSSGAGIGSMGDRFQGMPGAGGGMGNMGSMTDLLKLAPGLLGGGGGNDQPPPTQVMPPPAIEPGEPIIQMGGLPPQSERVSKLRKNMLGVPGPNDPFLRG